MIYFLTVNYYSTEFVEKLIASIQQHRKSFCPIVIVNNSPEDTSIDRLKIEEVKILEAGHNLGFGRACNLGLEWIWQQNPQAIVWLINPDAELLENSLISATQFFEQFTEVSILGTTIFDPAGKIWFGGGQFMPNSGKIFVEEALPSPLPSDPYLKMDWVSGCSVLINLKNFTTCPHFDSDYFLYYEDVDLCKRYAKQGHLVGFTPQISIRHHPSSITQKMPDLKCQQSIYSYLLTLEKHAPPLTLLYRLTRISVSALLSLAFNPRLSLNELKGVLNYGRYFLQNRLLKR